MTRRIPGLRNGRRRRAGRPLLLAASLPWFVLAACSSVPAGDTTPAPSSLGFYYNTAGIGFDDQLIHLGTYTATPDQLAQLENVPVTINVVEE